MTMINWYVSCLKDIYYVLLNQMLTDFFVILFMNILLYIIRTIVSLEAVQVVVKHHFDQEWLVLIVQEFLIY
jgi:hypothetical protein